MDLSMNAQPAAAIAPDVEGGVKAIITEILGCSADHVTMDATIGDDLGAKAIDRIDIALEIERDFAIVICGSAYLECSTVSDVVAFVETRLRQMGKV